MRPERIHKRKPTTRHKLVCVVVAIALPVPALSLAALLVFSMSPGQAVQSAQVGMSMGAFMPYFGLYLMGVSGKAKTSFEHTAYGYDETDHYVEYVDQKSTDDASASATLLIPHNGARSYFATSPLRPYVFAGLLKSMPFVSAKVSETARYYGPDGTLLETNNSSTRLAGREKDALARVLGFWGMNLGFGAEYPFSENFSVGGEYGPRFFRTSAKGGGSSGSADGFVWGDMVDSEVSASLKLTAARIVLNCQF